MSPTIYPSAPCPVCGARPLRYVGGECVRCPQDCILREAGVLYLHRLARGQRTEVSEEVRKLDLENWVFPIFLGFVVEAGFPPLLACAAQTAKDCMELLRKAYDLRKCEPCVIELVACRGQGESKGAA